MFSVVVFLLLVAAVVRRTNEPTPGGTASAVGEGHRGGNQTLAVWTGTQE